jgi:hypothetical protein
MSILWDPLGQMAQLPPYRPDYVYIINLDGKYQRGSTV